MILHAGLVAMRVGQYWRGVLIEGPSGSGKSDLALRALEAGLRLVADDRTVIWTSGGKLYGRAPDALAGLVEARGVGVLPLAVLPFCQIALAVRCDGAAERMREPEQRELLGLSVPVVSLGALEASAPAKLRRALEHLGGDA